MAVDAWELKERQALPLDTKINMSLARIREWYEHWGGKVHVSFSGGKDSTVLLHLVRSIYPEVPAVFVDTGLEYPEIRSFVKIVDNVVWLRPKMPFNHLIKKYGFVYPSKETAKAIYYALKGSQWAIYLMQGRERDGIKIKNSFKERFIKYNYLLNAPFKISHLCCEYLKERPVREYEKVNKTKSIVALMADESQRRKAAYLKTGCNSFNTKHQMSKPMSFWTKQDVLTYLKLYNIPYATIYGDIIRTPKGLITTGEQRTGCMFCLVGCHLNKPNKFQRMKLTHPVHYKYCMEKLGLARVLDYIGVPY